MTFQEGEVGQSLIAAEVLVARCEPDAATGTICDISIYKIEMMDSSLETVETGQGGMGLNIERGSLG